MADDVHTVRAIDYRATFPFISIFRAFRVATDPTKLGLSLVGLLLLYIGGRTLDAVWPDSQRAVPREVELYAGEVGVPELRARIAAEWQGQDDLIGRVPDVTDVFSGRLTRPYGVGRTLNAEEFRDQRTEVREFLRGTFRDDLLTPAVNWQETARPNVDAAAARAVAAERLNRIKPGDYDDHVGVVKDYLADRRQKESAAADAAFHDKWKTEPKTDDERKAKAADQAAVYAAEDAAYRKSVYDLRRAKAVRGEGLFITFLDYESNQLDGIVHGALELNPTRVINSIYNVVAVGPVWALRHHWVYFTIFFLYLLLLWAIFGGAIARIAAVQVARDEKISLRQALLFSVSKVLSFVFAPLIPLIIILAVGLLVAAAGALGNVPFVGPIIVGAFFVLALIAGLVLALTAFGLLGGFSLMYPTIAVEGTDSFDAVSRSFSYLYARPWQLAFYTAVALVYGAVCYLFVRFFIYVLMKLTHLAAGAFIYTEAPTGTNTLKAMWPEPSSFWNLSYNIDTFGMGGGQATGAVLMSFWNYLLIALVGAFAISIYFSANTIIYYLMRKEVDATEMDDVYLEQGDDDFIDTVSPSTGSDPLSPVVAGGAGGHVETPSEPAGKVVKTTIIDPDSATTASTIVRSEEIVLPPSTLPSTSPDTIVGFGDDTLKAQ